jgi:hypothetical protein
VPLGTRRAAPLPSSGDARRAPPAVEPAWQQLAELLSPGACDHHRSELRAASEYRHAFTKAH